MNHFTLDLGIPPDSIRSGSALGAKSSNSTSFSPLAGRFPVGHGEIEERVQDFLERTIEDD